MRADASQQKKYNMRTTLLAATLLLASCGGGSSGGAPPPPPPVNLAPTITSLTFAAAEDRDYAGTVTATDPEGSAVTFTRTSDPAQGTVMSFTSAGAFTYRPPANFVGSVSFSVRATDSANAQTTATITINVANADDDAPTLRADILQVTGSTPLVDVLANDTEADGEALTLMLEGSPDFGTAAVETGRIRFTLPAGFKGFNRFRYRAADAAGQGGTVNAVLFVDTPPVRVVYIAHSTASPHDNLYVDDFVSTRKITAIETTAATDGLSLRQRFTHSADGRTIVFEKRASNNVIRELGVVPADGSWAPRRISPEPVAGTLASYELLSGISPDGRWVLFKQMRAGQPDRFFIADLTQNGATTEFTLPAGAAPLDEDDSSILFGPTSQYAYFNARFDFPGAQGSALYRLAVASPGSAAQLVSPAAVAGTHVWIVRVASDESRILYLESPDSAESARVRVVTLASPATPLTVSHSMASGRRISGFVHSNAAMTRIYYVLEIGVEPNQTFELYGADAAQANSGVLIGQLPADRWRPEIWMLSPDESSMLFTSPRTHNNSFSEAINLIGLTPGGAFTNLVPTVQWLPVFAFADAGRFVVYGTGSYIFRVPTSGTPTPAMVMAHGNGTYDASADGAIIVGNWNDLTPGSPIGNYLYAANTLSASGVQEVRMTGVNEPGQFVSTWGIIPGP